MEVVRERFGDLECGVSFGMGVTAALRTRHRAMTFSRGVWLDETIEVGRDNPPDADVTRLKPREETWPGTQPEGLEVCKFSRRTRALGILSLPTLGCSLSARVRARRRHSPL